MRTEGELRALVVLLADEEDRVASVAWETLKQERERAVLYLQEAANDPDPRLRGRARMLIEEMRLAAFEDEWRRYVERPDKEMDLERGCLMLARLAGDVDEKAVGRFLDAIAGTVRAHMEAVDGIQALGEVLFDNLGFRGGDLDAPENHYLTTVLERRIGIPISLTTVYVLVGLRLGLPVSGVAAPNRFLARYERVDGPVFIDCCNRGRMYGYETMVNWLTGRGLGFADGFLAPCSHRFTLFRMMNNLERAYTQGGNERMADLIRRFRDHLGVERE